MDGDHGIFEFQHTGHVGGGEFPMGMSQYGGRADARFGIRFGNGALDGEYRDSGAIHSR